MAYACVKCGNRTQNPKPKCPRCGAEVAPGDNWHRYLTFVAIACVVAAGSPFGSWCVQALIRLFRHSSGIYEPWQGSSAAYVGVITAVVLGLMLVIITVEKRLKARQHKEP